MNKWIILGILLFIILILSILQHFTDEIVSFFYTKKENLEMRSDEVIIVPDFVSIPEDRIIPSGYYQIHQKTMAILPDGNTVTPLPQSPYADIPDGYYIVTVNGKDYMGKVPDGFTASGNKRSLLENTKKYDPNNYDVIYHDDPVDANTIASSKTIYVRDQDGNLKEMTYSPVQSLPIYYEPGSFQYGSTGYVPSYEDSIFLSKTTNMSSVKPLYKTAAMMGGFCNQYKSDPNKLEQTCNSIPSNYCASTTCCVLLGGDKCVSGNQYGPTFRANFTDKLIKNKDFYYYLGKCYGNCDKSPLNNIVINKQIYLDEISPPTVKANISGNTTINH
jgi:hypothetical protein